MFRKDKKRKHKVKDELKNVFEEYQKVKNEEVDKNTLVE